jgi:signal transduction histidine kinase
MMIADYFQGRGFFQLLEAQTQAQLLSQYEQRADQVQLQSTRTIVLRDDHEAQQQEVVRLKLTLEELSHLRQQFDQFLATDPRWVAGDPTLMRSQLTQYEQQLHQQAETILAALEAENIAAALQALSPEGSSTALAPLHRDLNRWIHIAYEQESAAAEVMETAQGLEKLLIVISMTIAGLIAAWVAWKTTRAISTPLVQITQVAREVANRHDYTLRAPVVRNDEVGLLANSLNHLIEQVEENTQSLKQAAQTTTSQKKELEVALKQLRQAQAQLVQAEKMSSLGQLVAGIAHEINNPISFIHGNLKYVQDYSNTLFEIIDSGTADLTKLTKDDTDWREEGDLDFIRSDFPKVIQSIKNGADRINGIVLSLKVFARLQEAHLKFANLHEGLESVLKLLGHRLKPQAKRPEVTVTCQFPDLPPVECYGSQINQVFMNILTNAIDAIDERWERHPGGWQPRIEIRAEVVEETVCFDIQNNGMPMSEAVQAKILDPFFTTKPVGRGVGLGLSISYEIISQQHQGRLTYRSPIEHEMGAAFHISIPLRMTSGKVHGMGPLAS